MKKIKTKTGFEWEINDAAFDDMRLVDSLVKIERGSISTTEKMIALNQVATSLLGDNGKEALFVHVEKKTGKAGIKEVTGEIYDMLEQLNDKEKKS